MNKLLPDYNAPSDLSALLAQQGFSMQKKFGQNFLINPHIRNELVQVLALSPDDCVWEVGAGLGAITNLLLKTGADVTAFEIDHGFIRLLHEYFNDYANFTLIEGDVLKTWGTAYQRRKPSAFFGNLPYNIAAKIIADCIEAECLFDRMVVTVQKEVGMRMSAPAGSADYSSFSVLCQRYYTIKPIRDIAPTAFWPKPRVESRALLLQKQERPLSAKNNRIFLSVVRALFSARRKTIKNNLAAWLNASGKQDVPVEDILTKAELAATVRAETLTVYDFIRLSDILSEL